MLPRKTKKQKERAKELFDDLSLTYPDSRCALNYTSPFELLVATILSAQCTDVRVNIVTEQLFKDYPGPEAFATAPLQELEEAIRSTGFYRNKALSLKTSAQLILDDFGGEVPRTMQELLTLRGAARKTANVVLGNAFGINQGVVVDTHIKRLSLRFGLTEHTDTGKNEKDLMALFPRQDWTYLAHLFIAHGRGPCKARAKESDHFICRKYGVNCSCQKKKNNNKQPKGNDGNP
ncbi:MAG: endonuclease III [Balneolales bacterium]